MVHFLERGACVNKKQELAVLEIVNSDLPQREKEETILALVRGGDESPERAIKEILGIPDLSFDEKIQFIKSIVDDEGEYEEGVLIRLRRMVRARRAARGVAARA